MLLVAGIVFCVLFFISAPYGRHARGGWGPEVPAKMGWLIMEAPASLIMLIALFYLPLNTAIICFVVLWQVHYFHRAFIYPFTLRTDRSMPISVVVMAIIFNTVNGLLNVWHFHLFAHVYSGSWFATPQFVVGVTLFAFGFFLTKHADRVLLSLRRDQSGGTQDVGDTATIASNRYAIPYGGLYRYVSCPNYLGESIQWLGWALFTLSPAGLVFLIWTLANLVPRAISHHRWYRREFPDYPGNRKAIFPFLI